MDVEEVFHMNGGTGDTSYATNSHLQKKASDMVKHLTIHAIQQVYLSIHPADTFCIADLGCSSGPNTLSIVGDLVEAVDSAARRKSTMPLPEIRVCLNDLPTNDFNSVFKSLPDFYRSLRRRETIDGGTGSRPPIFVSAHPASFYGRLFPASSLHFIYSSYGLHWLSKVPPGLYDEEGKSINKGNIYIAESSPPAVSRAYVEQFQSDFSMFLRFRAEELVGGGRMVLILTGRIGHDHVDRGNSLLWQLLSRSLAVLASQGGIEEERIDSYDVHFYASSRVEIEAEIKREGLFELERFEIFGVESKFDEAKDSSLGREVARTVRSVQETMLTRHFGDGLSLDRLFHIFASMVDEELAIAEIRPANFILVLRKL
ncbi:Probable methyltransferase TCM_000336 [Linum grandiflorum]